MTTQFAPNLKVFNTVELIWLCEYDYSNRTFLVPLTIFSSGNFDSSVSTSSRISSIPGKRYTWIK